MEKQAILSIALGIVSYLILFILFVQFYMLEQMGDYIAGRTTTTSRLVQVTETEFPTVTICMDPSLKPSSRRISYVKVWVQIFRGSCHQ